MRSKGPGVFLAFALALFAAGSQPAASQDYWSGFSIGIGAGGSTHAQVLVINDMLGLTPKPPKFCKNFLVEAKDILGALRQYAEDVKLGVFPDNSHIFNE